REFSGCSDDLPRGVGREAPARRDQLQQPRRRLPRPGRASQGGGVPREGAGDPPRGPGGAAHGRRDQLQQPRHRLPRPGRAGQGGGVPREGAADFLAAADVLERLRGRDAGTGGANSEQAAADKVLMGERVADLATLTVRAAARLAALERRPQRLITAYEAAERGSARVFLEALGRSRAAAVGAVEPEALAEEQRLRAELRLADARAAREIDQPAQKVNRQVAEQRLAERQKAEDALHAFVARLERAAPRYAAMKYPRPCSLDEARACLA